MKPHEKNIQENIVSSDRFLIINYFKQKENAFSKIKLSISTTLNQYIEYHKNLKSSGWKVDWLIKP